jgi:hypothetical protein
MRDCIQQDLNGLACQDALAVTDGHSHAVVVGAGAQHQAMTEHDRAVHPGVCKLGAAGSQSGQLREMVDEIHKTGLPVNRKLAAFFPEGLLPNFDKVAAQYKFFHDHQVQGVNGVQPVMRIAGALMGLLLVQAGFIY